MQRKRATLVLIAALLTPVPCVQASADDMFSTMFRMMLTMMNVMSDAMLDNNSWGNGGWGNNNWLNNWSDGLGGFNSFNLGMNAMPMMGGMWSSTPWNSMGWSPWTTVASPWTSPWSSMGGSPWNSLGSMPWSSMGGSPWNSFGSTPWNTFGGTPWNNMSGTPWTNPWSSGGGNPFAGGYPGTAGPAWGGPGNPANYGTWNSPGGYSGTALLDGRWYGNSGEILEIRGNRFRLQQGKVGLNGRIELKDNIVSMYSPQTNTVTRYTFVRNQSGLLLQDASGTVLRFTNNPVNGVVHVF